MNWSQIVKLKRGGARISSLVFLTPKPMLFTLFVKHCDNNNIVDGAFG